MAASFSVTRRFFDDKNYPRGFSRHGDYTIKESQVLEQYGQAFKALDSGERKPTTKEERARELFLEGCNCAQAVFLAFAEDKLDRETALKIASGFGGGMAGMRDVCGAVSGMFMAYGLLCGPADPTDRAAKTNNYAALRQLAGEFEARNGSIICRQLLGLDPNFKPQPPEPRTDSYYKKRPCPEMVYCAADILEEYLSKEG